MIRISSSYSRPMIDRYYQCVSSVLHNAINGEFSEAFSDSPDFIAFFNDNIRDLLIGDYPTLVSLTTTIRDDFPVIIESFNPSFFYKDFDHDSYPISKRMSTESIRSYAGKKRMVDAKDSLIEEINIVAELNSSYYLRKLANDLATQTTAIGIKEICSKLNFICQTKSTPHDDMPQWVSSIKSMFNYEILRSGLLNEMIEDLNLKYCPMCNISAIDKITHDNITHIPAFDHFLSKSRYPFLSLSLYNLIPCCHTCNSVFKLNKETFSPPHSNPYNEGVDNLNVFNFSELVECYMYNSPMNGKVVLNATNTNNDNNIKLFGLEGVYNRETNKNKINLFFGFFREFKRYSTIMSYDEFLCNLIGYDPNQELYKIEYGKLKKDLVSFMQTIGFN